MKTKCNCDYCGKETERYFTRYNREHHHYCSNECYLNALRQGKQGKVRFICDYCGKEAERIHSLYYQTNYQHHYCSRECADNGRAKFSGSYDGRHPSRLNSTQWNKLTKKVRDRARRRCEICRIPEGNGRQLEVHHKIPVACFNSSAKANRLSNLIAVCSLCHGKLEAMARDSNPRFLPLIGL